MMKQAALSVDKLKYSYGTRHVLQGLNFDVDRGCCTMLLGPNGAGKTTLFSLITGLLALQSGSITLPHGGLAKIGIVFQQAALDADLTVQQNLRYHGGLHGLSRQTIEDHLDTLASRFEMQGRLTDKVRDLNGGHKRRVEIMRALLTRPDVLLLDEPTSGLDIPTRHALVRDLHDLCTEQNIAVLWATHLVDEVLPADAVIVLNAGRVVAKGKVADVLRSTDKSTFTEAYLVLTETLA